MISVYILLLSSIMVTMNLDSNPHEQSSVMGGGARNTAQIDIIQGASSLTGYYVGLLCRISLKISHVLLSKWIHILVHRLLKRRRGPINHKFTIRDSEKPVQSEAVPFSLSTKLCFSITSFGSFRRWQTPLVRTLL